MRHTFETEQWLPFPVELVFAFFANPQNLPRLMPTWQQTRIDHADLALPAPRPLIPGIAPYPATVAAGAGSRLSLSFRPFPLAPFRIGWDAEIAEFVWNDHFCDIQVRGPFAYWRHCHSVAATASQSVAGTTIRDHVVYEMPFGPAGELAQRLFGRIQFRSLFKLRHQRAAELIAEAHRARERRR